MARETDVRFPGPPLSRGYTSLAIRGAAPVLAALLATLVLAARVLTAVLVVALTRAGLALRLLRLVVRELDRLARLFVVLPLARLRAHRGHLLVEVLERPHRGVLLSRSPRFRPRWSCRAGKPLAKGREASKPHTSGRGTCN